MHSKVALKSHKTRLLSKVRYSIQGKTVNLLYKDHLAACIGIILADLRGLNSTIDRILFSKIIQSYDICLQFIEVVS